MLALKYVFLLLHIITAAAWFGMGLRLATQARTVLRLERTAALGLADDTQRTIRFMGIFAVLTLVFGLATFVIGGPANYGVQFHTASLLIVILVAVHYVLLAPAWKKLRAAVEAGTDAEAHRKRVAMSMGIGQLLWLILLVLMFWAQLRAVFS